ncbi:hypothetical protein GDO86_016376 [Hymenochirus boettgeri]|uniref:Tubulin epsilon and delta complex protein 1 domain-containing protein n=1 Tax=Hymenochirus boettgeri TaxID=247094 RepID=A0A8T2K569_9PIPI|nr:hypothetical protein GDO86_016376 [Hymenochirus boettgeri]
MKKSGSSQLKEALRCLCRVLSACGALLSPETFRRAKFNRPETCSSELDHGVIKNLTPTIQPKEDVRYLQWLNGKIRFCWRMLHAAQQEKTLAVYKVHSYTQGCHVDQSISHLSVLETDLIRKPENYTKFLKLLELENSNLEAYVEWKRLEQVYFQWMVSVLESSSEDVQVLATQDGNPILSFPRDFHQWNNSLYHDIDKLNSGYIGLNKHLQRLVTHRKSSWDHQSKEIEKELNEKELWLMVRKMKQEAQKKAEDLKVNSAQAREMHGPIRLVFKEKKSHVDNIYSNSVYAKEMVKELQETSANLQMELQSLQEECRCRLDEIAEGFEGIICIPPPKG